jgi:phosphatidylinositol alpha-1,6-mannosyltransferase
MPSSKAIIVILNRNRSADLIRCLESVFLSTYADFEVILVDNASGDGSVANAEAWIAERDDSERPVRESLVIVSSDQNLGYAGGHNLGIEMALERDASYVLLLNSDVTVDPDCLSRLVDAADEEGVGAAGPLVLDSSDPETVWQAGARVRPGRGWVEGLKKGRCPEDLGVEVSEVDALVGCAILIKAEALRQVGLLDTGYFLYLEETDWFVRARRSGWRSVLVPRAKVWHDEDRLSVQAKSVHSSYYFARNRLIFVRKNFPEHLPGALVWSLRYGVLNNLLKRKWWELGMTLRGIGDFLMGRRGRCDSIPHVTAGLPPVIVFSTDYKPQPGGIAEHAYRVALGFAGLGAPVTVLAPGAPGDREFDAGQPFETFRVPRVPWFDLAGYLFVLPALVLSRRAGLVYCATSHPCAIICLLARVLVDFRHTVTVHAHEVVYSALGLRQSVKKAVKPWQIGVISAADRVFGVSRFTVNALHAAGVPESRTATIYNGVEIGDAEAEAEAAAGAETLPTPSPGGAGRGMVKKLGVGGKRIILTVSRLDIHKGHDVVIRALPGIVECVPDAVYVIAGDGVMREHLEELVRETKMGPHVIFAGHVPRDDLLSLYRACDVFVMISRIEGTSTEGFGIAFLEAAVFEKPSVGGRSGGIPDAVVDGVTGILVDPESPAEVASAVVRLLEDRELAATLGRAGRRRVLSEFTWERTLERIVTALK